MKHLFIFFIATVISLSASAQKLYLDLGAGFSKLDVQFIDPFGHLLQDYEKPSANIAFFAGAEYLQRKVFSLTSDLGLLQIGAKSPMQGLDDKRMYLNYFTINTAANFTLLNKKTKIKLFAGPRLDLYLNSGHTEGMQVWWVEEDLKKAHIGLTGGVGVFYEINNLEVGLKGRMYFHPGDFTHAEATSVPAGFEYYISAVHNFSVALSVGYQLNQPE